MIALQYKEYGDANVLKWTNLPAHQLGENDVLVLVKAAGINSIDIKIRQGEFEVLKKISGMLPRIMGMDFSGIVTDVGCQVSNIQVGDYVFGSLGFKGGSFADYVKIDAQKLMHIPKNVSFAEACTIPINGFTAMAIVNHNLKPEPGKRILINGVSGDVALYIIQVCKSKGAHISVVADEERFFRLIEMGVDEFIEMDDLFHERNEQKFDNILDILGTLCHEKTNKLLKEEGVFSMLSQELVLSQTSSNQSDQQKKHMNVNTQTLKSDVTELISLISNNKVKCLVGQVHPMSSAIKVLQDIESGKLHGVGKIVLVS